jgi:plasmid stabilization system protein ParE
MKVKLQDSFLKKLNRQVLYIATDKPNAARKFKNDLLQKCRNLKDNPFKFKKSIYFDRDDIRDMTFKGYTVVYKVEKEEISVFALLKHEEGIKK